MSANTVTNTVDTVVADKKITLAGKYTKFLVCGYWSIDRLLAAGIIDEATAHTARVELCLFAGPEKQNEMFDLFFAGLKDSTKSMKALVKEHNKPPKAKKEKVIKEKKPKGSKKLTVCDPQDELVAEIVAAAQTEISPGAEIKSVVRKGQGAAAPLRPPAAEDVAAAEVVVVTGTVEPVKKKVVKKGAPLPLTATEAVEPVNKAAEVVTNAVVAEVVANAVDAKKAAKALEAETKKAAKALEAETKKAAKALEDEAKKAAKTLEDEAKKAAKAIEDEAKKAAKALEAETKKAAKALEAETKKAAKALEAETKKAAKPTKKEKETKPPVEQPSDDDDEEGITNGSHEDDDQDTLNLRPISFPDGRKFLLDESNNHLYDPSCVDLDDFAPIAIYRGNQWFPLTPSLAVEE